MKAIFALALTFISCGPSISERYVSGETTSRTSPPPRQPIGGVEVGPFDSYVSSFEALYGQKVTTPMSFVPALEAPGALAVCRTSADRSIRKIEVIESTFKALEREDRQQAEYIIFHELGHCELGRPHTTLHLLQDERVPYSMMFPTFPRPFQTYLRYKNHYLSELFGSPILAADGIEESSIGFVGQCFI